MNSILTAGGVSFDLARPLASMVNVTDIAHHLAQKNRFGGAAARPISVAEHSLFVCEIGERELGLHRPEHLLALLLHDGHEAYCGDMPTPAKREIGGVWYGFERRFERVVHGHFDLRDVFTEIAQEIRTADLIALCTERLQLLPAGTPWSTLTGVAPIPWIDLLEPARVAMTWLDWRQAFVDRFDELTFARGEHARSDAAAAPTSTPEI